MTWTVHPARRRPATAIAVLVLVSLIAVLAGTAIGPGYEWTTWLFLLLLLASISQFLLPTTYTIDDEGISVRHALSTRRRAWKDIRRIEVGTTSAILSPFAEPRRLDRFRALVVMLDGAPEEARASLQGRIG